jgi:Mrp family chromosome partitioning ATPase
MWKADTGIVEIPDEVRKGLRKQTYVSNRAEVVRQMLSTQVEWPENTEMLLADMPPSTASKVFSFFDNMSALLGCIIVTQPSEISALGMRDTVCFLKLQEGPITKTMRRGNSPFTAPRRPPIVLADMPPSTASEVFSFFDNMDSLLGCIIVTQPSDISALGMTRTIDFLRHKQIPIMGLVTMMDGYLCPHCGKVSHQLLSPKLAMEKVARECGVPFLISIPQTPDVGLLKPYFDSLAKMVLKGQPITLKKQNLLRRVQG